ncbi:MAG: phosphonopyruvate decarboxylase [Candidatus Harrisonbacteria bacterium]|nr:phosphonopyruvate decarboxylase [Candidatus Harrisonbacteria bacterium]
MLSAKTVFDFLKSREIEFFTGVPDSLLKDFCAYLSENTQETEHVIAANEGNAVALASGFHLASGKYALVYMQNSGLGNAVNPLVSLADPGVYAIPMLLFIGWRGEDGVKDEPQHEKQGQITIPLLKDLFIPHYILPQEEAEAKDLLERACTQMRDRSAPVAIVVRKNSFSPHAKRTDAYRELLSREEALEQVLEQVEAEAAIVSTTGKLSRELFELRERKNMTHRQDFLMVGAMGHASSVALAIALREMHRTVYCFDGDGAAIMHLGAWPVIGQKGPANFKHVLFNNESHDSVGGQPSAAPNTDFLAIASASGYTQVFRAESKGELLQAFKELQKAPGPALLEIRVRKGARKELGRPTKSPRENKEDFMDSLHG